MRYRTPVNNKKKKRVFLKFFIILFILALLAVLANLTFKSLSKSDLFRIKKVKIKGDTGWLEPSARFIIGGNLSEIDVKRLSRLLQEGHPEIQTITVSKLWPDTVAVRFTLRRPIALIVNGQELLIDEKGALLEKEKYRDEKYALLVENLPLISGLNLRRSLKSGQLALNPQLACAFEIIRLFSKSAALRDFQVSKIEVKNIPETVVFIRRKGELPETKPIAIKIGERPYDEKLKMFEVFLKKAAVDWNTVEYIDLRFKEPIVGLKNG